MALPIAEGTIMLLSNGDTVEDGYLPHAREHERWCMDMKNSIPIAAAYLATRRVTISTFSIKGPKGSRCSVKIGRRNVAIVHHNPMLSLIAAAVELAGNGNYFDDSDQVVNAMNCFEESVIFSHLMEFKMAYNTKLKTYLCAYDGSVFMDNNPIFCLSKAFSGKKV